MKLLLVDESRIARACYRTLLEQLPGAQEIQEASSVNDATERCRTLRPDIILINIDLKEGVDTDAIRRLMTHSQGGAVIAISSHTESRRVDEMLQAGAAAFVLKKQGFNTLQEAIQVVLDGEIYLSEELLEEHEGEDDNEEDAHRPGTTDLTKREQEVLGYVADGHSSRGIAGALGLSLKTVETHRLHIRGKLGIHSVAGLTKYAIRVGLSEMG